MRVVPASMHLSVELGGERHSASLGDWERIHIRAERRYSSRFCSVNPADHAGRCYAAMRDMQRIELAFDQCGRFELFKTELRMTVYRTTEIDDVRGERFVYFDCHCKSFNGPVLSFPPPNTMQSL